MKKLSNHRPTNLKSIDQGVIQHVIQTYAGRKASGQGEVAARNAAIVVLREALPSWNFRAASDIVSQIIAGYDPLAQAG